MHMDAHLDLHAPSLPDGSLEMKSWKGWSSACKKSKQYLLNALIYGSLEFLLMYHDDFAIGFI